MPSYLLYVIMSNCDSCVTMKQRLVLAIQSVGAYVEQRLCMENLYGNWKKNILNGIE